MDVCSTHPHGGIDVELTQQALALQLPVPRPEWGSTAFRRGILQEIVVKRTQSMGVKHAWTLPGTGCLNMDTGSARPG